jgi:ABC-type polysaccharide/polyol phosphate transport system ATPase subunit
MMPDEQGYLSGYVEDLLGGLDPARPLPKPPFLTPFTPTAEAALTPAAIGYLPGYAADMLAALSPVRTPAKPAAPAPQQLAVPADRQAAEPKPPVPEKPLGEIILEAKDISIRFRMRRPPGRLIGQYIKSSPENARLSNDGRMTLIQGLSGVSLTLRQGEQVGLVGINGSGKTTLLRALSGIIAPEQGALKVTGNICTLLSISAGFDNELSAYDNLRLRALYLGIPDKDVEGHVADVIEFSGIGEFFFHPMRTYSAGMRARFALGLATISTPDLLIMDEWVGAGDMEFREKANKRLAAFVSKSGALLIASHSYAILQSWVTRIVWMHEGKVMADGPRDKVFAQYKAFLDKTR